MDEHDAKVVDTPQTLAHTIYKLAKILTCPAAIVRDQL